jgi:hypothetical protein
MGILTITATWLVAFSARCVRHHAEAYALALFESIDTLVPAERKENNRIDEDPAIAAFLRQPGGLPAALPEQPLRNGRRRCFLTVLSATISVFGSRVHDDHAMAQCAHIGSPTTTAYVFDLVPRFENGRSSLFVVPGQHRPRKRCSITGAG